MSFENLKLVDSLLRAVRDEGYTTPTPIQEKAIPGVLAGRDLLGCAQTGTGKTAAFALPILQNLMKASVPSGRRPIRVLVLTPTRELATQVGDSFATYGRHSGTRHTVIYGGVGQMPQVNALQRGVDILVATPGRLLDLMNQGYVRLEKVEVLVLDEADRMLDMGFVPDVRRIVSHVPGKRQTLMFSATMPADIRRLADSLLTDPVSVSVAPVATPAERIEQSLYYVEKSNKFKLLLHLLDTLKMPRILVFTRTKHGADKVVKYLDSARVNARAIHGNKSQKQREQALDQFKRGRVQVLVATDLASRGLDIDDITHVVNYDLPNESESYVHRIGRTARAGASGAAIAFCERDEREYLRDIETLMRMRINVVKEHPFHVNLPPLPTTQHGARHIARSQGYSNNRGSSRGGQGQRSSRGASSRWNSRGRETPARREHAGSASSSRSHSSHAPAGRPYPGRTPEAERPHGAAASRPERQQAPLRVERSSDQKTPASHRIPDYSNRTEELY